MPKSFANFRVIHTRYMPWSNRGPQQRVFEVPAAGADNECGQIDSTIVRARRHKSGAKKVIVAKKCLSLQGSSDNDRSMQLVIR